MEAQDRCSRCGGSNLEPGTLKHTHGDVIFYLQRTPFFTLSSPHVPVSATMCLDCGAIHLTGDIDKARSLTRSDE